MGLASALNRSEAVVIVAELSDHQKDLIRKGKSKQVQDERKEYWTLGLEQWITAYVGKS